MHVTLECVMKCGGMLRTPKPGSQVFPPNSQIADTLVLGDIACLRRGSHWGTRFRSFEHATTLHYTCYGNMHGLDVFRCHEAILPVEP